MISNSRGARLAAARQTLRARKLSTSSGRCGPCCSVLPTGRSTTFCACTASLISGQVNSSYCILSSEDILLLHLSARASYPARDRRLEPLNRLPFDRHILVRVERVVQRGPLDVRHVV